MKKIFCFLNGPYLGGAERSFILQAADVRERLGHDVRFFVPFLEKPGEEQKLISFLRENNFGVMKVHHFQYDRSLFGLSRNNPFSFLLLFPLAIIGLVKTAKNIHRINGDTEEGDVWWTGGNKIGFILFVLGVVTSFKGQFFWHFRDYPFLGGPYRFVWKLLEMIKTFNLTLIGNSFDVQKSLSRLVKESSGIPTVCLYNPVGKLKFQPRSEGSSFVVGTASMFAPWKGLHSLIVFAGLYENELKLLGISEFVIYGDEIYKTKGAHLGYKNSLERLKLSFVKDKSFVRFAGLEKPSVIFSELDVFIHSSLKPEPFGRVLLEAFHSATVLISTGLGGSGELFTDGVNGHRYLTYDYEGLLRKIEKAVGENHHYYLEQGKKRALEIEAIYDRQVVDIFS